MKVIKNEQLPLPMNMNKIATKTMHVQCTVCIGGVPVVWQSIV